MKLAKTIAIGLTLIYSLALATRFIGAYSNLKNVFERSQYLKSAYRNSVVVTDDNALFEIVVYASAAISE